MVFNQDSFAGRSGELPKQMKDMKRGIVAKAVKKYGRTLLPHSRI